ncbi:MAG: TolC family protein [Acidobacteriaceae bacterium]|nr:TolC family protein [Acidobacteriaceae bacterium]MBV9678191.1 TolC family protein [Acidobacteriaceae bacterium]
MFSRRYAFLLLTAAACIRAEVHSLTLRQALEVAARQNPDVVLARLDRQHAEYGIQVAQDPFRPKVYVGSGLAYTYGYPNSIEGNAPSLFQLRTDMAIFNRPKSYNVASAREIARGAELGTQAKAEEVAYQAADLFLRASQLEHQNETLNNQLPNLQRVVQTTAASVSEGAELPLELKRARVNLAMSEQRLNSNKLDSDYNEMMLAVALGYSANDRVKPVDSDLSDIAAPPSETEAADTAMRSNKDLRQMQANILAKAMDVRSFKAARLPQVDLVAQYAFFARYNYEQYFQKFQHNNFQLGASVAIPILIGSASNGLAQEAYTDMQKLRVQMDQTRNRILAETRRSYQIWQNAQSMRNLARMQLDLAREELTVLVAQNGEGRIPVSRVEQARVEESNKSMVFYEADMQELRAKLAILRQTGNLLAAIRAGSQGAVQP